MSDVKLQPVDWLWYPFIPFGKITMIQGNPGEGKTTLALRLAAACSTGNALPGMENREPFTILYQSAEDGLGSIDFRAAARSVLLVGRLKKEPHIRVIVHDKSSLAPEGKSLAFSLGTDAGFSWLDGYNDISSEELLCGFSSETKTAAAEELIRNMLSNGKQIAADDIFNAAQQKGISRHTVNEAKKNICGIDTRRVGKGWVWQMT